jgi:large subunit ribosomal protein L28
MGMMCAVCGKTTSKGNQICRRGKAKYLGGVGRKITGISRRDFRPNLQRIKVVGPGGTTLTKRVCTKCIRSGKIMRPVKRLPFQVPKQP